MKVGKPSGGPGRRVPVRRFVVSEDSMRPTLEPGDGLLAVRSGRARRGELRVFEHPHRPDFWLVKRVGRVRGSWFEAVSDQPVHAVDSRQLGDIQVAGSYRVVLRVPRRRLRG